MSAPGQLNPHRPSGFVQKIPNYEDRIKRGSVFQKVDLTKIDFNKIPQNITSEQELAKIFPLLKNNFLTKNLSDQEINKLAGAMTK